MQRTMIGALAVVALAACNAGQPRIYRVALDLGPTKSVQEATCFKNQMVPSSQISETNLFVEEQWVIWDGATADGAPKQFLDFGHQTFKLGDAPEADFDDLIAGNPSNPGVFTGQRVRSNLVSIPGTGSFVQVRQTIITASFADLGAAPVGTLKIDAKYACQSQGAQCPMEDLVADPRSCAVAVNFSARRIDVSRIAGYTEEGKAD